MTVKAWAVANQKGGVGKTTTAITLAGLLAERGEQVLVMDLDPHGSATSYFGFDPESEEASTYTLFKETAEGRAPDANGIVRQTAVDRLHLMPASTALATLDRQLGGREGMGLVIQRSLHQLAGRFDHVFIDCPPVLGVLMVNALAACEFLLIPTQTEYLALKGLERMLRTLQMVQRARAVPLPYRIIPCFFDRRTRASIDTLRTLRDKYSAHLWSSVIPIDTRFREASQAGVPLSHLHRHTRGLDAYRQLLAHLLHEEDVGEAVAL
ncbi:MAG: ParA family protein [Gammaproteobacteria bacterium]